MSKPTVRISVREIPTPSGEPVYDIIVEQMSLTKDNMTKIVMAYKKQLEAAGNRCYLATSGNNVVGLAPQKGWN